MMSPLRANSSATATTDRVRPSWLVRSGGDVAVDVEAEVISGIPASSGGGWGSGAWSGRPLVTEPLWTIVRRRTYDRPHDVSDRLLRRRLPQEPRTHARRRPLHRR